MDLRASVESAQGIGSAVLDDNILAKLPDVKHIVEISGLGTSAWARKSKISTIQKDGTQKSYYLKTAMGDMGYASLQGEYESIMAMRAIAPDFVPHPIAWGTLKGQSGCHFYLSHYLPIVNDLPEPPDFCEKLAQLHKNSSSPNGKYGFNVVTFNGNLPQLNRYDDSWEAFFAAGFQHMLDLNTERAGACKELDDLLPDFFGKVIPRLLRPLETGPNGIKPSLVHGNLWCGNAGVSLLNDAPIVFDPACFWAHNEYELGNWRPERNRFSKAYFNAYHSHFPKSSPEEDYDDRNILYSMFHPPSTILGLSLTCPSRFNLHAASLFPTITSFRESVIEDMNVLISKYPGGYEEYHSK